MRWTAALIIAGSLLPGCANPVVTDVRVNSWTSASKSATATIENRCRLGPILCMDARKFDVHFDGDELPASENHRPQVTKRVARLARGESMTLDADFTSLARIENNYLWNVMQIRVTADNVKLSKVPFSSELPIVVIDTLGGTPAREPKIRATMKIIHDAAGGRSFMNAPQNDYDGRIGIELRGDFSSRFCKRQYRIETWDARNKDVQVSLLQLPAEEDWILYGPYDDKTLMRNALAYEVSNLLGRYAPRTKFVELFVKEPGPTASSCPALASDGYVGVYVLMEKIKRDSSRVNVASLGAADNHEPAVTGGYMLRSDWPELGDVSFTTSAATGYGTTLTHEYPRCSTAGCDATTAQKAWIEKYMNDFEAALKGPGFRDPANGYARYIDVESFVDYYLMQELFKNSDGFRGSTHMHKHRGGKLAMGPIWDMNFTMGNAGWPEARPPQGWLLGLIPGQISWWNRLLEDPAFAQKVIDRWTLLRQRHFGTSNLHRTIDNWARYLRHARARNFARWPVLGVALPGNPTPVDANETHDDVVRQMKQWLAARANWIDSNVGHQLSAALREHTGEQHLQ